MKRMMVTMAWAAAIIVGAASCQTSQEPVFAGMADARPVKIRRQYQGDDPAFKQAGVFLIRSQEGLEATGSDVLAQKKVDFSRHYLVVVALGEQSTGGYEVKITGLSRREDTLYLESLTTRPGDETMVTQALTHPYAAAVFDQFPVKAMRTQLRSVVSQVEPQRR